jgi:hypothetical protein
MADNGWLGALLGAVSGVLIVLINNLFNKGKAAAEIEKIRAETVKIYKEISDLKGGSGDSTKTATAGASGEREIVFYDSKRDFSPFDFKGMGTELWDGEKFVPPKGEGKLDFGDGGILNVKRTNAQGRFEIHLNKYLNAGKTVSVVPKNDLISGARKIHVSCEAKAVDAKHTLRFAIKERANEKSNYTLAEESCLVSDNEWMPIHCYFVFSPAFEFWLKVEDRDVSEAPSSAQIRNLVLAEVIE